MANRDIVYQVILLIAIAAVVYLVAATTQHNLARLGVDSGIDFLWKRAGFEIAQTLVPFDANSTIARAFVVAVLNTLLLATVSIICASILGLGIGIARVSDNWLVSRLAGAYIEVFRNIPSLLQIFFFWYFVVLRTLPRSDESLEFLHCIFLNNRGLFVPSISFGPGWAWIVAALLAAWGMVFFLRRQARRRAAAPGRAQAGRRRTGAHVSWSLLILAGLAGVIALLARRTGRVPQGNPFRVPRRYCHDAGVPVTGGGPVHVPRDLYR